VEHRGGPVEGGGEIGAEGSQGGEERRRMVEVKTLRE